MARRPAEVSWWQNSDFLWLEFQVQSINGQSMKITNNPITGASNIKFKTDSDMNTLLLSKKVDLKKFTCMDETADSLVFQLTKKSKGFWDKISAENYSWLKLHEENQSQFENPKPKKPTQDQKSNQTEQPSDDYNKNEEIRKFKQMFGQQFRRYATDPNEAEVFEEMMAEITKNGYFDREAVQSRRNRERLNSNGYDDYQAWAMGRQFRSCPIPSRTGWVLVYFWKVSDNPSHPTTPKNYLKSAKNPMNIPH